MRSFHNSFGLNTVVLRLDTVYGPRQTEISNPLRISKDLATLHGDSTHAYDFIHSSDVIESLVIAEQSDNLKGEVIDIGTGVGTLLQDLAKKLNLNATLSNPSTPGQGGFVADTCKMKELLGFQARRKVEEEVEKLVEEVRGGEIFMQGWVNAPKIVRSAPWILPQRAKALAWTGLEGNVKSLIESLGPHDHTVSLTLWRDEPR
ncbi:hypothetical protein BC829DRAFT_268960 [Chytridium lagenaria]|nr:hypothetical protein BC829DRAFT_268960 [Chytridium lagenaria]